VIDLIDLHIKWEGHIVPNYLESRIIQKMSDVVLG
jgi:hypothetical protein